MLEQPPTNDTPSTSLPESEPPEAAISTLAGAETPLIQSEQPEPQSAPVTPTRPVRRRKGLIASLMLLAVLLLAAGGGFAYLRLSEVNLLEKAQVDLASGNWQAVEASCTQLMDLPANLLVEPQRCLPLRGEAYYHLTKLDQAQADLLAAQARYSDQAKPYLLSAEIYLQHDQPDLALSAAVETIKRDPTLVRPHMLMTGIYLQQGKWDLALAAAAKAQVLDDTLALPYTLQAQDAYQRNLQKEAEQAARAALERDPNQAPALRVLGSLQAWRSEYKSALENLDKALALDPQDQNALVERAVVYYWLDQFSSFQSNAQTILEKDSSSAGALMIQALQADLAYEPQKAYDFINQAVQLDGIRPEYYYLRACLFPTTEVKYQSQLADLARALELNPDLYRAQWLNLYIRWEMYEQVDIVAEADRLRNAAPELGAGYELMVNHFGHRMDLEQALDWANRYVEALPELTHSHIARAWVFIDQKDYEKAQSDLERALEIDPGSVRVLLGLVRIKTMQENFTEALKLADETVLMGSNLPAVYNERSLAHLFNKEPNLARNDVVKSLQLDPLNMLALRASAYLYIDDQDYPKATDEISKIAESAPWSPSAFTLRAEVYKTQADYQLALAEIKKSIEIDPYDPWAQKVAAETCLGLEYYGQALDYANAAIKLFTKDEYSWGLAAEANFYKGDYAQAIIAANRAMDINPRYMYAYSLISDASLAQGDYASAAASLEKALKYQDKLTIDEVQRYEQLIAFYHTVPPLVNGLRAVNDPAHGFSVVYSDDWVPLDSASTNDYVILTSKTSKDIWIGIGSTPVEEDKAYLLNTQLVADYYRETLIKTGYKFTARRTFNGLQLGIVDTIQVSGKLWEGDSTTLLHGQIYYFYVPGRIVWLEFYTPGSVELYSGPVEKIAATLKVIK